MAYHTQRRPRIYGRDTSTLLKFNPPGGELKERENKGGWHQPWVRHQQKQDAIYKNKVLEQQLTQCAAQVSKGLQSEGIDKQSSEIRVILFDAVRRASDKALRQSWPTAVSLRGYEKQMACLSRATPSSEFERGMIVRVKANGNYDVEKKVVDLSPARMLDVRRQMDRTGIRISIVEDRNVPPEQIREVEGARHAAFGIIGEPEHELQVLEACMQFDLKTVARLLGQPISSPITFGASRTGRY